MGRAIHLIGVLCLVGVVFPPLGLFLLLLTAIVVCVIAFPTAPTKSQPLWKFLAWMFGILFLVALPVAQAELLPQSVLFFMMFGCPVLGMVCFCKGCSGLKKGRR